MHKMAVYYLKFALIILNVLELKWKVQRNINDSNLSASLSLDYDPDKSQETPGVSKWYWNVFLFLAKSPC